MSDEDVRNKQRSGKGKGKAEPEPMRGRRQRIRKTPLTLTLDQHIIDTFGEIAEECGISRAAAMTLALTEFIKRNQ